MKPDRFGIFYFSFSISHFPFFSSTIVSSTTTHSPREPLT